MHRGGLLTNHAKRVTIAAAPLAIILPDPQLWQTGLAKHHEKRGFCGNTPVDGRAYHNPGHLAKTVQVRREKRAWYRRDNIIFFTSYRASQNEETEVDNLAHVLAPRLAPCFAGQQAPRRGSARHAEQVAEKLFLTARNFLCRTTMQTRDQRLTSGRGLDQGVAKDFFSNL